MNPWVLPRKAVIEGREYPHVTDFRDILGIIGILNGPGHPGFRWLKALAAFFPGEVPPVPQGTRYLADFLSCGQPGASGVKLMDWQVDAPEILSGVNAAAGTEVRSLPYLHWWSFLSYFHSIGEGRLSQLVAIRYKLSRGQKLENYEQEFYRQNKDKIRLRTPESPEDTAHRKNLEALLN